MACYRENSDKKNAAEYKIKSYVREIENVPYRFVAIHSSQLESKKRHTITKKILKDKVKLSKEAKFINKLKSYNFQYTSEIVEKESVKYNKRGKPSKDSIGISVISYHVSINIEDYDEDAFNKLLMIESSFVLITSILDNSKYSNERILKEYKNESSIERAFRFLKSPVYLSPIFLKKKERIEVLGYVFIIALMIASYLEYIVRKSINQNNEYLLEPNGSKNTRPSVKRILEILGNINILIIDEQSFF